METFLMTAAEAKAKINSLTNEKNEKLFARISKTIMDEIGRGNSSTYVSLSDMTPPIQKHLEGLGYVITKKQCDPCSGGTQYLVSWA